MGISQDLVYRRRKGERNIHGRFIIGAAGAFPGYKLDGPFMSQRITMVKEAILNSYHVRQK